MLLTDAATTLAIYKQLKMRLCHRSPEYNRRPEPKQEPDTLSDPSACTQRRVEILVHADFDVVGASIM